MKFFCEYCGNRIDGEKDKKCPHCGASYKKNKKFIELEKEKNENIEMNNEYKKQIMDHVVGTMKFSKFIFIIPVVFFLVILTAIIITFVGAKNKVKENGTGEKIEEFFNSMVEEELKESEKITVNFNEFAETEKYNVKVEKYEVVEDIFHHADAGYELVKFHLIVENKTQKEIRNEDVNCIVDGVAQTNDFSSGYSDLPFFIASELTVKGTATFIVPKNTSSYDIRYGDYVTIHIQK